MSVVEPEETIFFFEQRKSAVKKQFVSIREIKLEGLTSWKSISVYNYKAEVLQVHSNPHPVLLRGKREQREHKR